MVERYNVFHVERGEGLNTIDTKIGNRMKIVHNIRGEKLYNVHYFCAFLQKHIDISI